VSDVVVHQDQYRQIAKKALAISPFAARARLRVLVPLSALQREPELFLNGNGAAMAILDCVQKAVRFGELQRRRKRFCSRFEVWELAKVPGNGTACQAVVGVVNPLQFDPFAADADVTSLGAGTPGENLNQELTCQRRSRRQHIALHASK